MGHEKVADIGAFLESYRLTWQSVCRGQAGIETLTEYFALPSIMVDLEGQATLYESAAVIQDFNEARRAAFAKGGVTECRFRGVDLTSQGPHLTLAMVNWELLREDRSIERAWRHYYTLKNGPSERRILVSAFQTGA